MRTSIDWGLVILILIFAVLLSIGSFGCYLIWQDQEACHRRGGAFVKGFMGYECVVSK